ncbi:hypothetical protein TK45_00730 [Bowmanella sp. JS7-9]|nr:hypothetical protein TK45_00730 [Bowmanella sp. JS7-9]
MIAEADALQITLSDFHQLKGCAAQSLIAERNTTLGKLQAPSQRFLYQRALLEALGTCQTSNSDDTLVKKLAGWQQDLQARQPYSIARLVDQSREITNSLTNSGQGIVSEESYSASLAAFSYLARVVTQQVKADSKTLETHLQQIDRQRLPKRLYNQFKMQAHYLNALNDWQNNLTFTCPNGRAGKSVEYAVNVFNRYFIQGIQADAGQANQLYYTLMPTLETLKSVELVSPEFRTNIDAITLAFNASQQAIREHVTFWQDVYRRCEIKPGKR